MRLLTHLLFTALAAPSLTRIIRQDTLNHTGNSHSNRVEKHKEYATYFEEKEILGYSIEIDERYQTMSETVTRRFIKSKKQKEEDGRTEKTQETNMDTASDVFREFSNKMYKRYLKRNEINNEEFNGNKVNITVRYIYYDDLALDKETIEYFCYGIYDIVTGRNPNMDKEMKTREEKYRKRLESLKNAKKEIVMVTYMSTVMKNGEEHSSLEVNRFEKFEKKNVSIHQKTTKEANEF